MCQVYGPTPMVGCSKCGAGYYEGSPHTCKKFVSFEKWDAELQASAKKYRSNPSKNSLIHTMEMATRNIASWPKWKREYVWAEEFQHCVREGG